jgi:hypothetical protein
MEDVKGFRKTVHDFHKTVHEQWKAHLKKLNRNHVLPGTCARKFPPHRPFVAAGAIQVSSCCVCCCRQEEEEEEDRRLLCPLSALPLPTAALQAALSASA